MLGLVSPCNWYLILWSITEIIKFRYLWHLQTFVIVCLLRILLNCCVRLRKWRTLMDEDAFNYSTSKKLLKDHCYFCSMVIWILYRSGSSSFIYVQDASCSCLFLQRRIMLLFCKDGLLQKDQSRYVQSASVRTFI